MYKAIFLKITVITMLLSSSVWSATDGNNQDPADMPMTKEGHSGMMMTPEKMEEMMASDQHQDMQMMHMMMHRMSEMGHGHGHGYDHNRSMTDGEKGKMMMNSQMMQMRKQHMNNMEQRLENIESLLSQLMELQKQI